MTNIRFMGAWDARVLSSADLKKHGVEDFTKTMFPRGQAVEVSEEVAEVLLSNAKIFGKFEKVEEGTEDVQTTADVEKPATPSNARSTSTRTEKVPAKSSTP